MSGKTSRPTTFRLCRIASLVGPSLALLATAITFAGTDDMHISNPLGWQIGLFISALCLGLPWIFYFAQNHDDQLVTAGLISLTMMLGIFWIFGYVGYFFYFCFAPIEVEYRIAALLPACTLLTHWAISSAKDVHEEIIAHDWMPRLYIEGPHHHIYTMETAQAFSSQSKIRSPIRSHHIWLALLIAPSAFALNRILTPYTGSGHGVFMVLSLFGLPMSLWLIGIGSRTYLLMIHYPLKLQRQTGKPVLMHNFD